MVTFVLVQGGWVGGWYWQKLIPFLEAAGHEVYAHTLTGLAERASELSPDVGLDTHIQDIVGMLEEKEKLVSEKLVSHLFSAWKPSCPAIVSRLAASGKSRLQVAGARNDTMSPGRWEFAVQHRVHQFPTPGSRYGDGLTPPSCRRQIRRSWRKEV
jgi:hypothetical protein